MVWLYKPTNRQVNSGHRRLLRLLVLGFLSFACIGCTSNTTSKGPARAQKIKYSMGSLEIDGHILTVELAETDEQRQNGLMFRRSLDEGTGMLFIFPGQRVLSFWMKNTLIPLSIGYFNKDKQLVDIQKMNPESPMVLDNQLKRYPSQSPAMYALEVPQGWFEKNNVEVGATFSLSKAK
jgi:uncharacterized membrane protein (UPF0127 family)